MNKSVAVQCELIFIDRVKIGWILEDAEINYIASLLSSSRQMVKRQRRLIFFRRQLFKPEVDPGTTFILLHSRAVCTHSALFFFFQSQSGDGSQ